jgi:Spy/CpxP family protein refolding chaperone
MFGFLLGTACLVGLIWVVRGGRAGHGYHSCGGERWRRHRNWDGGYRDSGERWGFGKSAFLRWLFERLDTTPGQERVIRQAVDDFVDHAHVARREAEGSKKDIARALRGESFDAEAMAEAFGKHDSALAELRRAAMDGLAKIHEVLDDRQRARLSELLESGIGRRFQGPYRSWA